MKFEFENFTCPFWPIKPRQGINQRSDYDRGSNFSHSSAVEFSPEIATHKEIASEFARC